jgi:hypothetical protein
VTWNPPEKPERNPQHARVFYPFEFITPEGFLKEAIGHTFDFFRKKTHNYLIYLTLFDLLTNLKATINRF